MPLSSMFSKEQSLDEPALDFCTVFLADVQAEFVQEVFSSG